MKKILLVLLGFSVWGCQKQAEAPGHDLIFNVQFDPGQVRLNNLGQPADLPAGHAAQSPQFREMSIHYIELAPDSLTLLGKGAVAYQAQETTINGKQAVLFDEAATAGHNQEMVRVRLKDIPPGTYHWVRASVTYQSYDIKFNIRQIPNVGDLLQQGATIASFVGFNTYITQVTPRSIPLTVNAAKPQGFWVFESDLSVPYNGFNQLYFGQAPEGATTVVNPLFLTSPVPPGSCVVTGRFEQPLVVTGKENADIAVDLAFSTNRSFEWVDDNANGELDFYGTPGTPNEKIVDMGLRGLVPKWRP